MSIVADYIIAQQKKGVDKVRHIRSVTSYFYSAFGVHFSIYLKPIKNTNNRRILIIDRINLRAAQVARAQVVPIL